MRLWSLHPKYLDSTGLVGLWREALLAQAVLLGNTIGYTAHPQLERFRAQPEPVLAIGAYLTGVLCEAQRRDYNFDCSKIVQPPDNGPRQLSVTTGQLRFERRHLLQKLRHRHPSRCKQLKNCAEVTPHPSFRIVEGPVEDWEKGSD